MRTPYESGFTLIELITVIVILGVLLVVVAPRYFDMQSKAKEAVGEEALAEAVVHFNLAYMEYVVDIGSPPDGLADLAVSDYLALDGSNKVQVGGYRFCYVPSGEDHVAVTAETLVGGAWSDLQDSDGNTMTRTIPWP